MFKKTFLTLLFVLAGTLAHANGDAMPQILASLDSATENKLHMMTDSELSEAKGTGVLPNTFVYAEHYYVWNFYGNENDYRSYIYTGGSGISGGIESSENTAWVGEVWKITKSGQNAPMSTYSTVEARLLELQPDTTQEGYYFITDAISFGEWNRPWDGNFRITHNQVY